MKAKGILLFLFTLLLQSAGAMSWFVNVNTGDDTYDGTAPLVGSGGVGPKKTITAALTIASNADTIFVSEGVYAELLVIDKAIVLFGNNFGTDPLFKTRNPETIIVSPGLNTGSSISGNSLVEITSCCVEINGFMLNGDDPNAVNPTGHYNKEYEISYGIGGSGTLDNVRITNMIISNFTRSGIYMSGGLYSTKGNLIDNCLIRVGDLNSEGITLSQNFYTSVNNVNIDSTGNGLALHDFSDKSNHQSKFSFMTIRSEFNGLLMANFQNYSDSLYLEYNTITGLDTTLDFNGITLNNVTSSGRLDIFSTVISLAKKGYKITDCSNNMLITLSDQNIFDVVNGIWVNQGSSSSDLDLTVYSSLVNRADSNAIFLHSDGGLLKVAMKNIILKSSMTGITGQGNVSLDPGNTQLQTIKGYYVFLDSSASGFYPAQKIDATACMFDGVTGNSLSNNESLVVEDKIRHYLDHEKMGWVMFKDKNLYVTGNDGNLSMGRAHTVASNNWNIYFTNITTSEQVTITKQIHLYTQPLASVGMITMNNAAAYLFLHGKLLLTSGLKLNQGIIEVTDNDTLIVSRSISGTTLSSGNAVSFVKGSLYVRYSGMPVNYNFTDTIPVGRNNDFRPIYINATWPTGASVFVAGYRTLTGKSPMSKLPAGITHASDIRYWQIFKPYSQNTYLLNKAGLTYDTKTVDDLVNNPANLRVLYYNIINTFNLGGTGTAANTGSITSTTGTPGFGYYFLGNALGGNNILSANYPIALLKTKGFCANDSIEFSGENSASFRNITVYDWTVTGPSTVAISEKTMKVKRVIPVPGNYTITLVTTNSIGFKDTATASLTVLPLPEIHYSVLLPCFPLPIDLTNTSILPTGTSIAQTEWKINSTYFTTTNLKYTPSLAGNYSGHLKVTLNTGCFDSAAVGFISPAAPVITLTPNNLVEVCNGDSVIVRINRSPGTIIWNDGNLYDSLILKTNTFKKATVFASAQCYRSDSVTLNVLPRPVVNAGPDLFSLPGEPVKFKGSSDGMIEWIPTRWLDDATILKPTARALATSKYVLRAYNTYGCEAKDSMMLFVNTDNNLNVPNLLTPNGDGHNDKWVLSNFPDSEKCAVDIYTREGINVFTADPYMNNFDGTKDGKELPDGYYVFVIKSNKTGEIYTGILSILK